MYNDLGFLIYGLCMVALIVIWSLKLKSDSKIDSFTFEQNKQEEERTENLVLIKELPGGVVTFAENPDHEDYATTNDFAKALGEYIEQHTDKVLKTLTPFEVYWDEENCLVAVFEDKQSGES